MPHYIGTHTEWAPSAVSTGQLINKQGFSVKVMLLKCKEFVLVSKI